ncbi:MAG TPA: YeeE/YedE family protein [Flavobacteriales bacterium]|nr:YeeE/YedE family protein [Flavobacteriales bacterium]HIN40180.1 YeeE/YedE family protein [Flavobacteriales bacterium]
MKLIKYLIIGILFGIIMTKSEAISWFRIQEMFRFQSFHMYGIIGSALLVGIILTQLVKRYGMKSSEGIPIAFKKKDVGFYRYLLGGIVFGFGWALSGACPGPMFTLVGNGVSVFIVVILSAVLGTFTYGALRDRLPH